MDRDETQLAPEKGVEAHTKETIPAPSPISEPAPTTERLVGPLIDERYLLEELIGEGGMGHVYKAKHILMGKMVAIKLIHSELAHVDEIAKRFQREARSSSLLTHPNCISVTDFGRTKQKQLFLAMEFLEGEELDARLEREGKLEPQLAIKIISQVLKGLAHAHEQGVIHRDLKPENIFLIENDDDPDFVKILDFGIAKMASESESESLTKTGVVFGTPKYLSPEQALGDKTDHRADLYAVGIILFEMLTGNPPYNAETAMDTMSLHLTAKPPKLAEHGLFPKNLQRIIDKAMAKKPKDRFKDAQDFLDALEKIDVTENSEITIIIPNIVDSRLITRARHKAWEKLEDVFKSKRNIAIALGGLVGLILLLTLFTSLSSSETEEQKAPKDKVTSEHVLPSPDIKEKIVNEELQAFIEESQKELEAENFNKAAIAARKALAVDSTSAHAHLYLGHALFQSDKLIGAIYQYQHAIKADETLKKDEQMLKNLREGLQWELIRSKSAQMIAQHGGKEDIEKLTELANSALTNGEVRRAARVALVKAEKEDLIDWVASLGADFREQKTCKERNLIITEMVKTGNKEFIPFLKEFKPKTKRRKKGAKKTQNACLKASIEFAIRTLSNPSTQDAKDTGK